MEANHQGASGQSIYLGFWAMAWSSHPCWSSNLTPLRDDDVDCSCSSSTLRVACCSAGEACVTRKRLTFQTRAQTRSRNMRPCCNITNGPARSFGVVPEFWTARAMLLKLIARADLRLACRNIFGDTSGMAHVPTHHPRGICNQNVGAETWMVLSAKPHCRLERPRTDTASAKSRLQVAGQRTWPAEVQHLTKERYLRRKGWSFHSP